MTETDLRALVGRVEECGSAYLPAVNAFYVRQFQMMHVAEDATRFLHQACQGLPNRLEGGTAAPRESAIDQFYTRIVEHAIAYFGSRVLDPSRPAPALDDAPVSRAAIEKAAQAAGRDDNGGFEVAALALGQRLGSQIYNAYLAGKVAPRGLRRLFLMHIHEPGLARKACRAMISKLRSVSRSASRPVLRAAHV